jgi:hypothetical protein
MKVSALAIVLPCATGVAIAQSSPLRSGQPPDVAHRLERLATLDLTDAAREQLKAETVQQLTPVLTATQLKKFEVLMGDHHGPGDAQPAPEN